uniref:ANK_REP_REGION domain-containing protein n=1 Tax=Macrostomum lignano TaxID=282301 RepID=A0A1I8IUX8_9PLAT
MRRPSVSAARCAGLDGTNRNAGQQSSSQQGTSFSPEEMSSCIRQAAQDIQSLTGTSSAGPATWAEPRSVASAAAAAATSSRNGQTNQRLANRNYQQQQPAYQLPSYQADPFSADDYQQLMMQPQPQQQSLQSGDLLLADIVRELSGARNQRHEQRKFCMQRLIGLVRDKTALNWDDHFKNILLILLETLSENESDIRACALSALQELLRAESARFVDFVEVTVLKVLEAHRDQDRSVAKAADDCAKALSACLPADQILRVLIPIVLDSEVPITLAAIKMEMRVVQEADSGLLERLLAELCPGLVRACEHQESPIRKAAIFCLVQVQLKVGDSLMLHLGDMSGTKRQPSIKFLFVLHGLGSTVTAVIAISSIKAKRADFMRSSADISNNNKRKKILLLEDNNSLPAMLSAKSFTRRRPPAEPPATPLQMRQLADQKSAPSADAEDDRGVPTGDDREAPTGGALTERQLRSLSFQELLELWPDPQRELQLRLDDVGGGELLSCRLLHAAVAADNRDGVRGLLEMAPGLAELSNSRRELPIHVACRLNRPLPAALLLPAMSREAVNSLDGRGRAPLHWAVELGEADCLAELLVSDLCDLALPDSSGRSALDCAREAGPKARACLRLLESAALAASALAPLRLRRLEPASSHGCRDGEPRAWGAACDSALLANNCFGEVEFPGLGNTAQFCRVAQTCSDADISQLLLGCWALSRPSLVLSVHGSNCDKASFKAAWQKGLWKTAAGSGAWIVTDCCSGLARKTGQAARDFCDAYGPDSVRAIGVCSWGRSAGRECLRSESF